MVRGDSAYGNSRVVRACIKFSFVLIKNRIVQRAIASIPDTAWTPVRYPGAVRDPDTDGWISDAEVAETSFTAFSSTAYPVSARLIVRRVKDARYRDALFPVWRYHPFFYQQHPADDDRRCRPPCTRGHRDCVLGSDRRTARAHAVRIVWRELCLGAVRSDRPQPAARRRNRLRRASRESSRNNATAQIVNIAARFVRPQRTPTLHLPRHWPWLDAWLQLWRNIIGISPPTPA